MLCFIRGKWATQVADQIAKVFGKMLHPHLVEVIASLFIGLHDEMKHFFTGQLHGVLCHSSLLPINALEIPFSSGQKPFPKCFVAEDEGDVPHLTCCAM